MGHKAHIPQQLVWQGLQLGGSDKRASALSHLIELLRHCELAALPAFLLLENVVGFESSGMRHTLYQAKAATRFST